MEEGDIVRGVVCVFAFSGILVGGAVRAAAQTTVSPQDARRPAAPRAYEGPPLTLEAAIEEAQSKNPDLTALREQIGVLRQRPAQERALEPATAEATVWQWPVNTLNPANTNMFMFMLGQNIPGRGKRDLRAAVDDKDVALAESDVAVRAGQ